MGPGTLIADRYRLVSLVGTGGMGAVWEARDERLQRPVALKLLRAQPGLPPEEAELANSRAMREARINARLHHPHAVAVFDVVEHDGQPGLVMELVPSIPLSSVLRELGVLEQDEAARMGAQVAAALAAAHRVGIVHRDVKPGNILIGDDGAARISDFGISHALGDVTLTTTGLVSGTPAYLAPEVARGEPSGFASDVFSLGATLYAATEGAPPFGTDTNAIALLHKVAAGQFTPPRHAGPLTDVTVSMLTTDPTARPAMSDVAQTLSGLASPGRISGDRELGGTAAAATALGATQVADQTSVLPVEPTASARVASEPVASEPVASEPAAANPPRTSPAEAPAAAKSQVKVPAAAIAAAPATATPGSGRRRRGGLIAVLAALVLAAVVAGALLLPDGTGTSADPGPGTVSSAAESSPAPDPSPPAEPTPTRTPSATPRSTPTPTPTRTATPTPRPSAPTTRSEPRVSGAASAGQLATAITSYYALIPGNTDAAWPRMTDFYQSNTAGGRRSYERFWGAVSRVEVADVRGLPPDRAEATVTYFYKDGRTVRERTAYGFVNDDGRLRINSSTVLSSAGV